MPIESTDRSKAWLLTSLIFSGVVFTAISIQPAMAQSSVNHASIWGPLFRSQVTRCWKKPAPVGDEAANMQVVIEISLTREGRLVGQPLVSSESSPAATDYSKAYQKTALRAIVECQPYSLPAEYYGEWKHFMPVFVEFSTAVKEMGKRPAGLFDTRTPSICRGC